MESVFLNLQGNGDTGEHARDGSLWEIYICARSHTASDGIADWLHITVGFSRYVCHSYVFIFELQEGQLVSAAAVCLSHRNPSHQATLALITTHGSTIGYVYLSYGDLSSFRNPMNCSNGIHWITVLSSLSFWEQVSGASISQSLAVTFTEPDWLSRPAGTAKDYPRPWLISW